ADYGVGAAVEGLQILADLTAVLAPQPFGRELDRRQWILDLVGDAAGDVLPRRVALRRDQTGDVVEGQDRLALAAAFGPHAQPTGLPLAGQVDLLLGPGLGAAQQRGQLRRQIGQSRSRRRLFFQTEQPNRLLVEGRDAPLAVQADDPGADAGQHRLDKPAAGLGL